MSNRILLSSLLGFLLVSSFVLNDGALARENSGQSDAQKNGQADGNPQAIIDPLFDKDPNARPGSDKAIIDPLFKPDPDGSRVKPENDNDIIDPLFHPAGESNRRSDSVSNAKKRTRGAAA